MESGDVGIVIKPLRIRNTFAGTQRPTLVDSRLPVIIVVNTLQQGLDSAITKSANILQRK